MIIPNTLCYNGSQIGTVNIYINQITYEGITNMQNSRLSDICYSFMQSHEYNHIFKSIIFDIKWLEDKLDFSDISKLENIIMNYSLQIYQTSFECGFTYGWQLFHECQEMNH